MKRRTGGGLPNTNKHTYLTPTQDKVIPLNRELPAWKKAWKLLSENGGTHGTGRKFNLAYSTRLAREVKGSGLNALCEQKPYHLTSNEKQEIMKDLLRQKSLEKQQAISDASRELVMLSNRHGGGGGQSPTQGVGASGGAAPSPNKMGKKLQASATTALTALLGWQNHRSVERSSQQQQYHRSPHQHADDYHSHNESYHHTTTSISSNHRHHHSNNTNNGMDSNGYAREHYMRYPIGAVTTTTASSPQHQHESGGGVPVFSDDEGVGGGGDAGQRGAGKTFTVASKRVQLEPMSEAQPPQAAML